ncbi:polyketide cyclase/dehydrase/lipid transport protein [Maribacter caenipelagi]|uniref:Polyketide cyclase/dehydrase/lipid transport protein n=1 Tax=Maribacter caenipelagi TaxID=1447781 RepID=A0A4R7D6Z9_9FLAO|nr:SRPBCC domain-containing protein [Maribacter caenipelagi]TDS15524.1 polyketide cyclase/dehydrase/lipid transport protein [Maribacter caenipelagi]
MNCETSYLNIKKFTLLQSLSFIVILPFIFMGCGSKVKTESTSNTSIKPIEEVSIKEIDENHYSLVTSITIDAATSEVWEVLTDFENMSNWSSTLQKIDGIKIENGQDVNIVYKVDGQNQIIPHNLIYSENKYYGWSDTIAVLPGVIDRHLYEIRKNGKSRTKFIQSDEFRGYNPNRSNIDLARFVLPQYLTFNRELKAEVERRTNN